MITDPTKKYVKNVLREHKEKKLSVDKTKALIKEAVIKNEYVSEMQSTINKLKENMYTKKGNEIAEYLQVLAYSSPFKSTLAEADDGKGARHPQLARSFGYMVSAGENATLLYNNLIKMYPLLNRKLLRMISLMMGKTNKILQGKSPNEVAKGKEETEPEVPEAPKPKEAPEKPEVPEAPKPPIPKKVEVPKKAEAPKKVEKPEEEEPKEKESN